MRIERQLYVRKQDHRWALTTTMRLLSASQGGEGQYREQLGIIVNELANEEPATRSARTWALVSILGTIADGLADQLEQDHGVQRQDLLSGLERGFEESLGLLNGDEEA